MILNFKKLKRNRAMSLWLSSTAVFQKRRWWSISGKGSGWIQIACSNNEWEKRIEKFYHQLSFQDIHNIVRNRDDISVDTARAKFRIWPVMTPQWLEHAIFWSGRATGSLISKSCFSLIVKHEISFASSCLRRTGLCVRAANERR